MISPTVATGFEGRLPLVSTGTVLRAVERYLTPEEIALTIQQATKKATQQRRQDPAGPRRLEAESRKLKTELERFGQLVADGKGPQTVKPEMPWREARLAEIEAELSNVQQKHPHADEAEIRKTCGDLIGRFKDLLLGEVRLARQALRRLLDRPLRISPATVDGRKTLRFDGDTVLGHLVDPIYRGMASPREFEPLLPP